MKRKAGSDRAILRGHGEAPTFNFSADSKHLASISAEGLVVMWDVETGKRMWDVKTDKQEWEIKSDENSLVPFIYYSPDNKYLFYLTGNEEVHVSHAATGVLFKKFSVRGDTARFVFPGYKDEIIVTGESRMDLRRLTTGKLIRTIKYPCGAVEDMRVECKGKIMIDITGRVMAFTGRQIGQLENFASEWLTISPDGKHVAGEGSTYRSLGVWDVETGKLVSEFKDGHSSYVSCGAYSPDGKFFASGSSDMTVIVWNMETGKRVNVHEYGLGFVNDVRYSPDGKFLAIGYEDGRIILLNKEDD